MFNCIKYFQNILRLETKHKKLFLLICETVQICRRAQPASPFTGEKLKRKMSVAKVANLT